MRLDATMAASVGEGGGEIYRKRERGAGCVGV